ncbi:UrcA family protein [Sphingomonas lenta]|uniref:UrcA family protein n=1 Tax=Sphingomonas lenta TaxID=1141887 RepID=A0A2A2SCK8_9SPHN|nr:UrcA family protein [Sphingomonas lenta]PAX06996.1 hypothetical protein CKY28_13100 [Sphingomonas lenta]
MNARHRLASIAFVVVTTLFPLATAGRAEAGPTAVRHNLDGSRSVHVSYADLNLATEAGKATFNRRLRRAYRAVCPQPGFGPGIVEPPQCRRVAAAGAKRSVELAIARHVGRQDGTQLALATARR